MLPSSTAMAVSTKVARLIVPFLLIATAICQNPANLGPADPGIKDPSKFDSNRPLGRELETNVPDGFTLVTVGDCIISRPLLQYAANDEGFRKVMEILKRADVTYGNMETSILDIRHFTGYPYPGPEDVTLVAAPEVAKDLAQMGFDLVSRANNHALDWGVEGMRETSHWLEGAGIAYAGAGENLGLAQAAGYFEGAKGRIGLVSMASTFRPGTEALPAMAAAPARPGINALTLKKSVVVSPEQMAEVVRLRNALYPGEKLKNNKLPDELSMLSNKFVLGKSFGFPTRWTESTCRGFCAECGRASNMRTFSSLASTLTSQPEARRQKRRTTSLTRQPMPTGSGASGNRHRRRHFCDNWYSPSGSD